MTTTAKIAARGTNGTGITEEMAARLHDNLGEKVLAVVELVVEASGEKRNGDESVALSILTVEPAPDHMTVDHLRELARSFYYERQLATEGPTLDGDDIEPKVADVLAAGQRHTPHPYLASTLSTDDNAPCDVCGHLEAAPVHADRARLVDPFNPGDDEDLDDNDDEDDGDIPGDPDNDDPDAA